MSNMIFSRRTLQRLIDRLASALDADQLAKLVDRLNRPGDQRLPTMWEVVMLDALASAGRLRHEIPLESGRQPDFELEFGEPGQPPILLIGDITTVSDAGPDKENPIDDLSNELTRLARKCNLNPNNFGWDVRGRRVGDYGNGRVKLFLPQRAALLAFMKKHVEPWIKEIAATKPDTAKREFAEDEIAFSLTYSVGQQYASGSYQSYDVAASRSKNPLFSALKSKVDQLRAAPENALRMLIACDGDCALLSQSRLMTSPGTFTAQQVAQDFLRQNRTIDFVLLVGVESQNQFSRNQVYRTRLDLVIPPANSRSARMTQDAIEQVSRMVLRAAAQIPTPVQTAVNAAHRCGERGTGPDALGGYEMGGDNVRISARALQRLLAGEISQAEFLEAHDWQPGQRGMNPFARARAWGQMIKSATVIDRGEKDDDWLEFRFGFDAAAGPFQKPAPSQPPAGANEPTTPGRTDPGDVPDTN